jgi:hypothetical protein
MYPNLIYCIDISKIRQINDIFVGTERILIFIFYFKAIYIFVGTERKERGKDKREEAEEHPAYFP